MFGMSEGNEAHIFGILRDTLYSDKELAVIREYSTNAWDAHREAGIGDVPIKVSLPTSLEPSLVVRDYGKGMSEEDVFGTYTQYGASTKRGSNLGVGHLGIGSKSAFCYSDTFTITSFHEGVKRVYVATLDESNVGQAVKLFEEPCGDETGIEIKIPVDPKNIHAFHRAATTLFPFFQPTPHINIPITPQDFDKRVNGFILTSDEQAEKTDSRKWIAVMGCVPYRLDFSKFGSELLDAALAEIVKQVDGGLYFDIGEITHGAHREEVSYTEKTKLAVLKRLKLLFDELVGELLTTIENPTTTPWERRLAVRKFAADTKLPVPPKFIEYTVDGLGLYSHEQVLDGDGNPKLNEKKQAVTKAPKTFRLHGFRYKKHEYEGRSSKLLEWPTVEVDPTVRILLRDTVLPLRGYRLGIHDHVVSPINESPMSDVEAELQDCIEQMDLVGIPVIRLSTLSHDATVAEEIEPTPGSGRTFNQKHVEKHFVLRDTVDSRYPLSNNWDIVSREPTLDDIFVVVQRFEVDSSNEFYKQVKRDRQTLKFLGGEMPPIYGIKSTVEKPVRTADVLGTPYKVWREAEIRRLLATNQEVQDLIENHSWALLFHQESNWSWRFNARKIHKALLSAVPETHPLVVLFARYITAHDIEARLSKGQQERVEMLYTDFGLKDWQAPKDRLAMEERYPLLHPNVSGPGFGILGDPDKNAPWIAYIQLMDQVLPS